LNFPAIAIVILNYNGKDFLEKFLPSVLASTYPNKKIIVADNASVDDSVAYVQQNFNDVEIIALDKNYGFAGGYNEALKQVASDYYILLNSDVEVTPGWIEDMIALLENDKTIAACQPKILSYHDRNLFEYAGACGGWIDALGYPFARGRVFDTCETDKGQYDNTEKVFWATGAALCIRSGCFHEMGGFDSYLFAHMEEIDLCWRLQRKGYSIYCCPSSKVYHVGGGTLSKTNSRKAYLNFRNNFIMLLKNLPLGEKLWKLPLRIVLDWIFAFKSLLQGDVKNFSAVFKAQAGVMSWMMKKQAHQKLPVKKFAAIPGVFKGSLVWAYFVQKRKHFAEIISLAE
jgi:GT2 family glycosyltransferase